MERKYTEFAVEKAVALLGIDSPTGYTKRAAEWVKAEFEALGFSARYTAKGGVLVELGGGAASGEAKTGYGTAPEKAGTSGDASSADGPDGALLLEAHTDTLGGMVAEIKANGRLRITNLGGLRAENGETENVRLYTRDGRVFEGTFQLANASVHVNTKYGDTKRDFDACEVVLDEDVASKDDVKALGIDTGDIVCFEPRTRVTASGYLKSRFLDDKLSVGILLGFAKYVAEESIALPRKVYVHITVFEETGHGGAASVPADVTEVVAVDMGCVGEGLACTERQVSICVKDSGGPYHYDVVTKLVNAAKAEGADYALDVYPAYGSDAEAALRSGNDIRHGLIGAGVYASHGYERSHKDGVENTLKVLAGYLK